MNNSPKDYLTDREKLMEKIREILVGKSPAGYRLFFMKHGLSMSEADEMINGTVEQLLTLLTSEVEKERERLLKEVEEKLLKRDEVVKTAKTVFDGTKECIYLARATLKAEQRKALSDIGGGK